MFREITTHEVSGLNDCLQIHAVDMPGSGGANHVYRISARDGEGSTVDPMTDQMIRFQNGPVQEAGVNGVSMEALLAIVLDRLEGFQSGKFACALNGLAKIHVKNAMHYLHERTSDRVSRGVEGKSSE